MMMIFGGSTMGTYHSWRVIIWTVAYFADDQSLTELQQTAEERRQEIERK